MPILIKRLGVADIGLLKHVAEDVFDDAVTPDRAARFLSDERNILIVAVDAGRVVGQVVAFVHQHLDAPDDLFIENLGVAEAWRRQGVARRLLAMAFAAGAAQGATTAWVATEEDNTAANGLYGATGATRGRFVMFSYDALDGLEPPDAADQA